MPYKVSVITCCYNQQNTVARAIRSVEDQELPWPIEHIIIDDGSNDETATAIKREMNGFNKYLSVSYRVDFAVHSGLMRTYEKALSSCGGEYIAFCDGDDYWIDSEKLIKQAEYMDVHPECGLCTTRVYNEINDKLHKQSIKTDQINSRLSFDSMLKGTIPIHAQSYLLRKSAFDQYINFRKFVDLGFGTWDLPIVLELIRYTKFHCMDFYSAVFMKRSESVTQTRSRLKRLQYLCSQYKIKAYYIAKYGCKPSTIAYLLYRIIRDIYSVGFKRWK